MICRTTHLALALLLTSACAAAPQPESPTPQPQPSKTQPPQSPEVKQESKDVTPEAPPPSPPPFSFEAEATEPTEEQAYLSARRRLLVAVTSDDRYSEPGPFSDAFALVVHMKAQDHLELSRDNGGISVKLALEAERLLPTFERLLQATKEVKLEQIPQELRPEVLSFRSSVEQARLCSRAKEVLNEFECVVSSSTKEKKALNLALKKVRLMPVWVDGIPASDKRFLRPLLVQAEWVNQGKSTPISDLPIAVAYEGEQKSLMFQTDAQGLLSYEPPEEAGIEGEFQLSLDLPWILGETSEEFHQVRCKTGARKVSFERAAVIPENEKTPSWVTAEHLKKQVDSLLSSAPSIKRSTLRSVSRSSGKRQLKQVQKLADEWKGQLDTIVLVDAESEFASRMGTHRVWFEARGRARVVDAWTGKTRFEISGVATESGVGETRAERAAEQALARDLAKRLKEKLREKK